MDSTEKLLKVMDMMKKLKMTRTEVIVLCESALCANLHHVQEGFREAYLKDFTERVLKTFQEKHEMVNEYVAKAKNSINN